MTAIAQPFKYETPSDTAGLDCIWLPDSLRFNRNILRTGRTDSLYEAPAPRTSSKLKDSKSPFVHVVIGDVLVGVLTIGTGTATITSSPYNVTWATDAASTHSIFVSNSSMSLPKVTTEDSVLQLYDFQATLRQIIYGNPNLAAIAEALDNVLGQLFAGKCLPKKIASTIDSSVVFEFVKAKNVAILDVYADEGVVVLIDIDGEKTISELTVSKLTKAVSIIKDAGF